MKICKRGLNFIQVYNGNGDVRICSWLKRSGDGRDGGYIGNLLTNSFREIYHSDKAKSIRERMINGDYSMCSQGGNCPFVANNTIDQNSIEIDDIPEYPSELWLAFEGKCNYHCTVCSAHKNMEEQLVGSWENKYDIIESRIREVLPYVKRISANGRGELFCGKRTLKLLSEWKPIAPIEECSVSIETNGSLFDEKHWKQIENLGQYRLDVNVTVMSFEEKAYQYLSGTKLPISTIENNLRFMKSLREKNIINYLEIATVVQERNFREMPTFCKRCIEEFGADKVRLRPIIMSGASDSNLEWFADIRNPEHPYYSEYLEIWNRPELSHPKVYKWSGSLASSVGKHPGIKAGEVLNMVDRLLMSTELDSKINDYIKSVNAKYVSLYGVGRAGKLLIKLLNDKVSWGELYDGKASGYCYENKKVISPSQGCMRGAENCIIITPLCDTKVIEEKLRELGYVCPVVSLDKLLKTSK